MDQRTINTLSLCSGGAGLDLGLELALECTRTICWVEWEAFAIEYLAKAMEAECLDKAPVWTDLRTFDGRAWRGVVDCIIAGYPCQPFSVAGRRRGSDDPRHLWPHVRRVVGKVEPALCFFENVPGHVSKGLREVIEDLEGLDYQVATGLFAAEEVGASHKRERLFILALADAGCQRRQQDARSALGNEAADGRKGRNVRQPHCDHEFECQGQGLVATESSEEYRATMVHAKGVRRGEGQPQPEVQHGQRAACQSGIPLFPPGPADLASWRRILEHDDGLAPSQSKVHLVADGLADHRTHYLRLLGNGVVPLQAAYAFCSLWAALRDS